MSNSIIASMQLLRNAAIHDNDDDIPLAIIHPRDIRNQTSYVTQCFDNVTDTIVDNSREAMQCIAIAIDTQDKVNSTDDVYLNNTIKSTIDTTVNGESTEQDSLSSILAALDNVEYEEVPIDYAVDKYKKAQWNDTQLKRFVARSQTIMTSRIIIILKKHFIDLIRMKNMTRGGWTCCKNRVDIIDFSLIDH